LLSKGDGDVEEIVFFGKQLFRRINAADVFGLSAQLAYFFLLSLFPFLLFLITLLGYMPIDEQAVIVFIERYAPAETKELINTNINQLVNEQNGKLLSLSVIGTIWSASNGVNAIIKAFNKAYEVDEDRTFIVSRLIAIALTVAMVAVICIALALPIFGEMIGVYVFSLFGLTENFVHIWNMLRWVISSVVFFIVLLTLYKLAPNKRILLRNAMWGAMFATVGWQLVSLAFSNYVNTIGNYSATYGSLGAVIILMVWFYISGIIIITGGVINAAVRKMRLEKK
jgi:membrane protein